jgi:dihydroorotate dehydrogenase electron transfer subunit
MCNHYKEKITTKILSNKTIADNVYEMQLTVPSIVKEARAGQFVNLYLKDESKLLPRPISICEVDIQTNILTLVYAVFGEGTRIISGYMAGSDIQIMGPFGNGYELTEGGTHLLVGGGVGTPPLVELAKRLSGEIIVVVGFKSETYLVEELKKYATVYVATDDGSTGFYGTVVDVLDAHNLRTGKVYACGPKPMLKALQNWVEESQLEAQLSLEERMGCGFGACVGCVVKVISDNEAGYDYKKVCVDGPVFNSKEVIFS